LNLNHEYFPPGEAEPDDISEDEVDYVYPGQRDIRSYFRK